MKKNRVWLIAFAACLILVTLSPLASTSPDGLERVAEDQGFLSAAATSPLTLLADYLFPGIPNEALATMIAGWLGTIIVFAIAFGAALIIKRSRKREATD